MEICRTTSRVKGPRNCRHRCRRQKANVLMPNSFSCRNRRNKNPLFKMKQQERLAQRTLRSLSLFASSLLMYDRQMKYPRRLHMRTRKAPTIMRTSAIFSCRYVRRSSIMSIICITGAESRRGIILLLTDTADPPCRSLNYRVSSNTNTFHFVHRPKLMQNAEE